MQKDPLTISGLKNMGPGWHQRPRAVAPVWSNNSCGFAHVVCQEPSDPFVTPNRTLTRRVWADRRKEQHNALALMIPLVMHMLHVLGQRMAELSFPNIVPLSMGERSAEGKPKCERW